MDDIRTKGRLIEIGGGSARIDWEYPDIYEAADFLRIGMIHTRATDSFDLRFDSERNEWIVTMERSREVPGGMEATEPGVEVATIPAWLEGLTPVEEAVAAEREAIIRYLKSEAAAHGFREERTAKWTLLDAANDITEGWHHRTLQEAEAQETDAVDS